MGCGPSTEISSLNKKYGKQNVFKFLQVFFTQSFLEEEFEELKEDVQVKFNSNGKVSSKKVQVFDDVIKRINRSQMKQMSKLEDMKPKIEELEEFVERDPGSLLIAINKDKELLREMLNYKSRYLRKLSCVLDKNKYIGGLDFSKIEDTQVLDSTQ